MAEYQQLCRAAPAASPKVQSAACNNWRQRRPKWVAHTSHCQPRSAWPCGAPYLLLGVGDVEGGHRLHAQLRRVSGGKLLGIVGAVEVLRARRDMGNARRFSMERRSAVAVCAAGSGRHCPWCLRHASARQVTDCMRKVAVPSCCAPALPQRIQAPAWQRIQFRRLPAGAPRR